MDQHQTDTHRPERCDGHGSKDGLGCACPSCEAYRHKCEVRFVAKLQSNPARLGYLEKVEKARGKDAADRLRSDTWALMRR